MCIVVCKGPSGGVPGRLAAFRFPISGKLRERLLEERSDFLVRGIGRGSGGLRFSEGAAYARRDVVRLRVRTDCGMNSLRKGGLSAAVFCSAPHGRSQRRPTQLFRFVGGYAVSRCCRGGIRVSSAHADAAVSRRSAASVRDAGGLSVRCMGAYEHMDPRTDVRLGPDSYRPLAPEARRPDRISAGRSRRSLGDRPAMRADPTYGAERADRPAVRIPDLRSTDRRIFPAAMRRKREKACAPEDYASRAAPTKSSRAPAAVSGSSRKPM